MFAEGSAADEARAAGAAIVGGVELVEGIKSGNEFPSIWASLSSDTLSLHWIGVL